MINYEKDKRTKGIFQIICIIIGCILLLSIFIHPVSAIINITESNITSTSIMWTWTTSPLTNVSVDGNLILTANLNTKNYALTNLKPNETHIIQIYSSTDNGLKQSTTLPDKIDNTQNLTAFLFDYIWWIIAVILLVYAISTQSRMISFISAITCLIGMVKGISDKSFIIFMLYIVTFIAAFLISENLKE